MTAEKPRLDTTQLGQLQVGSNAVVTNIVEAPDSRPVVRRLAELGIRPGAQVIAGQKTPGGGRVVSVAGAQLAIDRATLRMLEVRPA